MAQPKQRPLAGGLDDPSSPQASGGALICVDPTQGSDRVVPGATWPNLIPDMHPDYLFSTPRYPVVMTIRANQHYRLCMHVCWAGLVP